MIYVLSEDSGGGLLFIEEILKILNIPKREYDIYPSHGNLALDMVFNQFKYELLPKDKLIVLFDTVEDTINFNSSNFMNEVLDICTELNVDLWVPNYYCFEELFLSSSKLIELSRNTRYLEVLTFIHNKLKDCDNTIPISYTDFVKHSLKELSSLNREKICKNVLSATTNSIKLIDFLISGDHFGKCWLVDCEEISAANKDYVCKRCIYFKQNKLQNFENSTILKENSIVNFLCSNKDTKEKATEVLNSF